MSLTPRTTVAYVEYLFVAGVVAFVMVSLWVLFGHQDAAQMRASEVSPSRRTSIHQDRLDCALTGACVGSIVGFLVGYELGNAGQGVVFGSVTVALLGALAWRD
jgi:hypothetical protein